MVKTVVNIGPVDYLESNSSTLRPEGQKTVGKTMQPSSRHRAVTLVIRVP